MHVNYLVALMVRMSEDRSGHNNDILMNAGCYYYYCYYYHIIHLECSGCCPSHEVFVY